MCRGCCCGTDEPDVADARHRALLDADVDVQFLNCLGPCGERDVVGVRNREGTTWFGAVDEDVLHRAVLWVRASSTTVPALLADHVLDASMHSFTPDHEMTSTDRPLGERSEVSGTDRPV